MLSNPASKLLMWRERTTAVVVLLAMIVALLTVGLLAPEAQAAAPGTTIKVTTVDDELNTDEDCSLREAVEAANTNAAVDGCAAGSDTERDAILFAVGQGATITLNSMLGVLHITDDAGLNMTGQTNNITISGDDASQVFEVETGAVFNLSKLTVADGNSLFGAGLVNDGGKVKVANSTFSSNSTDASGGAIENDGTMTVRNSTFSENSAGGIGGGIFTTGTLKVRNSTFSGNSADQLNGGGGIYNGGSTVTVTNSTFSGNKATNAGGGGGDGGGIVNSSFSTLEITNSTISGNTAIQSGGGIWNGGTMAVTNSTIFGNGAGHVGGGIVNQPGGSIEVTNSTISENSANHGGGIYDGGSNTLKNTIVANNTASIQGDNCVGFEGAIDGGYNISEDDECGFSAANNSMPSTDPLLASSLADHGGPTLTLRLRSGSPARNAIPEDTNGCGTEITTDQRGVSRPQGTGCDIGAFEEKARIL